MKKQIGITLIAQIIAFIINVCISFFLTPYIVEKIGVEANGFVGLANNFIEYAQLITVALNSMAGRFITIKMHQNKTEEANKYFTSVFVANIAISILLTVIFSFIIIYLTKFINISEALVNDVKLLWAFLFINFIISLFTSTFSIATFVKDRLDLAALCNIKAYVIRAIILIICYVFLKPFVWYIGMALTIMGLYTLIKHIVYTKRLVPEIKIKKSYFEFSKIIELIKSGIWNTISRLSSILSSGLDLIITNLFVNPIAMGVLALSKTIPTIILSLFGTISSVFAPQLTISYAKEEKDNMKAQLISAIKLFGLLSSIPIAGLIVLGKDFYTLWVPAQNINLLYILTMISCANLMFCLPMEPLYNIFTVTNKIKTSSIALILFSIASIICVFIGLKFSTTEEMKLIVIIAIGSLFNIIRVLTFLPIYGAKCLDLRTTTFYPSILKNVLSVIILSLIAFGIKLIIPINSWITFVIAACVIGVIGLIVNTLLIFNKEDRNKLINNIKNIFINKEKRHE